MVQHSAVYPTHAFILATLSSLLQATDTDFGYLGSKGMGWKDVWKFTDSEEQSTERTGTRVVQGVAQ